VCRKPEELPWEQPRGWPKHKGKLISMRQLWLCANVFGFLFFVGEMAARRVSGIGLFSLGVLNIMKLKVTPSADMRYADMRVLDPISASTHARAHRGADITRLQCHWPCSSLR
jgi:hypothetical protein